MTRFGAGPGPQLAMVAPKTDLGLLARAGTIAVIVLLMWAPSSIRAQSYTWGGTGSTTTTTDYNLGTNWSNPPASAPPVSTGQAALFDASGSATVVVTAGAITPAFWIFTSNSQNYTVSCQAVNFSGDETLTGTSSYTGTTTVDTGVLRVDGSIATSSMTTVNFGWLAGGNC